MIMLDIIFHEWKHFSRHKFKVAATLLFAAALFYGIENGIALYKEQLAEIDKINTTVLESKNEVLDLFDNGEKNPPGRPWVNITSPYWALWYVPNYAIKTPSPMMVYGIGQAEQYGYYKKITFWSTPYDADMAEELANPERLQLGALDFSFVTLFLTPLLLLIFLYNIKGGEIQQGFINLIYTQTGNKTIWLLSRTLFYVGITLTILLLLMFYGAFRANVFGQNSNDFWELFIYSAGYIFLWSLTFFLVINSGTGIASNALKMASLWLVFTFVIPGAFHQWVSLKHPVSYMTDLIDAKRDDLDKLFDQPADSLRAKLFAQYPSIANSYVAKDSLKINSATNRSSSALANNVMKLAIEDIEANNRSKNELIEASYWFNPITFFQNRLNKITQNHYDDYFGYRNSIQKRIDKTIDILILDLWEDEIVDKETYLKYFRDLNE